MFHTVFILLFKPIVPVCAEVKLLGRNVFTGSVTLLFPARYLCRDILFTLCLLYRVKENKSDAHLQEYLPFEIIYISIAY